MPAIALEPSMVRKIFVADDHVDSAETTADLLRIDGYDVQVFSNGRQTVDAARRSWPDMVFLDINMPVMDGYAAAAILRKEGPQNLVLVALTSLTQTADVEQARLAGFNHHLGKPVVGDGLCTLTRKCFLDLEPGPADAEHLVPAPEEESATPAQRDDVANGR